MNDDEDRDKAIELMRYKSEFIQCLTVVLLRDIRFMLSELLTYKQNEVHR